MFKIQVHSLLSQSISQSMHSSKINNRYTILSSQTDVYTTRAIHENELIGKIYCI